MTVAEHQPTAMDISEDKPNKISSNLVDRAVTALLKHHDIVSAKSKSKSLLGEDERITLQFTLARAPTKPSPKPIRIDIPHPLYKTNSNSTDTDGNDVPDYLDEAEVCLIVKESAKPHVQEMLLNFPAHLTCIKKVLGLESLRKKYNRFEQRRELLQKFDVFLCDDRILPMVGKCLGKSFFAMKKQPIPIKLGREVALPFAVERSVQNTFMFIPEGTCLGVNVGHTGMTPSHIVENAISAACNVAVKVPHKWTNIVRISIKTSSSTSLPFYNKTPEALYPVSDEVKDEKQEKEQDTDEKKKKETNKKNPLVKALKKQKEEEKKEKEEAANPSSSSKGRKRKKGKAAKEEQKSNDAVGTVKDKVADEPPKSDQKTKKNDKIDLKAATDNNEEKANDNALEATPEKKVKTKAEKNTEKKKNKRKKVEEAKLVSDQAVQEETTTPMKGGASNKNDDDAGNTTDAKVEKKSAKKKRKQEEKSKDDAVKPATPAKPETPAKKKDFIATKKFKGAKKGYAFRTGKEGLGYYVDVLPTVNKALLAKMARSPVKSKSAAKPRRRNSSGRRKSGKF